MRMEHLMCKQRVEVLWEKKLMGRTEAAI